MASQDIYVVLDYFGSRQGRAWRETGEEATSREVLIDDLMHGQCGNPARIVAFNTRDAWSRDVTNVNAAVLHSLDAVGDLNELAGCGFRSRYHAAQSAQMRSASRRLPLPVFSR